MHSRSSVRALAAALAGVFVVSAGAASAADPARLARTQAECDKIRAEFQDANHKAQQNADVELEALGLAVKADQTADMVRQMPLWEVSTRRQKMEAELERLGEQRAQEVRGAYYWEHDAYIIKVRVLIEALKDAELRARDAKIARGPVASDNSLDTFAQELRDKAAKAKAKAAEWTQKGKDGYRSYLACLAEVERQRAAVESPDDGDQYASAGGDDGYSDGYDDGYAGGYSSGGYDDIGSDAYPAGPTYRPPRVRPPRGQRPDRWTASAGYDDRVRGDRKVRGNGRRGDGARADGRGGRDDRRGGRKDKGGKGGKGGGSNCHANPLTGQQHCGDG